MKVRSLILPLIAIWAIASGIIFLSSCEGSVASANISTATVVSHGDEDGETVAQLQERTKKKIIISAHLIDDMKGSKMEVDADGYYRNPDVRSKFGGTKSALAEYVVKNLEVPMAEMNTLERTVKVQFGVDETGKVDHVSAESDDRGKGFENEIVKLVLNMPEWTPAKVQGRPVKTWQTLVINYQLK